MAFILSLLLGIGNFGGTEVLLVSFILLLLFFALIRRLLRSKPTVVIHQTNPNRSVADELRKLQELREQGVLTLDEFEQQKKRALR